MGADEAKRAYEAAGYTADLEQSTGNVLVYDSMGEPALTLIAEWGAYSIEGENGQEMASIAEEHGFFNADSGVSLRRTDRGKTRARKEGRAWYDEYTDEYTVDDEVDEGYEDEKESMKGRNANKGKARRPRMKARVRKYECDDCGEEMDDWRTDHVGRRRCAQCDKSARRNANRGKARVRKEDDDEFEDVPYPTHEDEDEEKGKSRGPVQLYRGKAMITFDDPNQTIWANTDRKSVLDGVRKIADRFGYNVKVAREGVIKSYGGFIYQEDTEVEKLQQLAQQFGLELEPYSSEENLYGLMHIATRDEAKYDNRTGVGTKHEVYVDAYDDFSPESIKAFKQFAQAVGVPFSRS